MAAPTSRSDNSNSGRPRMRARSRDEEHRASTPLELFFDLCFVVAVAQAASLLEHAVLIDQPFHAATGYLTVFFAIWWAWMNFTWFASAYDSDDVPYRLLTFVQIIGVLILAAGVPRAFEDQNYSIVTLGYVVMRTALVSLWLRAAHDEPEQSATSKRYAVGISVCMLGWLGLLVVPQGIHTVGFLFMVLAELSIPAWAERSGATSWHPGHIAERYGLFTLIVLGEAVAATTAAYQSAFSQVDISPKLVSILIGGPLIIFSMWWLYFVKSAARFLTDSRRAFVWGYGHYLIFGSAAAVGAGIAANLANLAEVNEPVLEVTTHLATEQTAQMHAAIGLSLTIPVAIFTMTVFLLHLSPHRRDRFLLVVFGIGSAAMILSSFTPAPVPITGVILAVLVATGGIRSARLGRAHQSAVLA